MSGLGGGHIKLARTIRILLQKILKILINFIIQMRPIVQSRTLNHLVRNFKAQRLNQMQFGTGGHTGSSDVACVGRHLRFQQNNIHTHKFFSFLTQLTKRAIRSVASFNSSRE